MFAISKEVETVFFFFNSILYFKFNFLNPYYMQVNLLIVQHNVNALYLYRNRASSSEYGQYFIPVT